MYVTHTEFQQSVVVLVEKLPSFVKLAFPFRKPIFGEVCCFFDLANLLSESSLVAWLWFIYFNMEPDY